MNLINRALSLGQRFFDRTILDHDLQDEVAMHIRARAEALQRDGMSPREAERQARIEFGSTERFKEECRDTLGGGWIDNAAQDVRFSLRTLRKSPAFFVVAVLTLALGIGATVAGFSVVNTVLLRPFAFRDPDRLLWIYSQRPDNARTNFNLPDYCDYRDRQTSFDELAAVASYTPTFSDSDQAERVKGVRLTANAFKVLGVTPLRGRTLIPADDLNGAAPVALISYNLWSRHYGRNEDIIGRSASLNGELRQIVGVLPRDFVLPNLDTDVVIPLQPESDPRRNARNSVNFLRMFGAPKAGVTAERAHAELDAIRRNLTHQFPDAYVGKIGITVVPLTEEIVGNVRPILFTVFSAAAAVLLVGCTNLVGISLARAAARRRELAVRTALGATRRQVVRLLLAESAIVAALGGVLGLAFEVFGRRAFLRIVPADLPRIESLSVDSSVILFAILATIVSAAVCGLAPAWLLSRTDLRDALISGGRTATGSTRRLRTWLVGGQIALALVLLANAGLLLRSFARLTSEESGFDPGNVFTARLSLPETTYPDRAALVQFYEKLQPLVASYPGVRRVGLVSILPLAPKSISFIHFTRPDQPPIKSENTPSVNYRAVSPDYFETMGIPLLSGRGFTERDDGDHPPVGLISAVFAQKYFADRSPVGQEIRIDDTDSEPRPIEIVGVVGAVKQTRLEMPAAPDLYLPLRQVPKDGIPWLRNSTFWVVKTVPGANIEPALRAAIRQVDGNVGVGELRTMSDVMTAAVAARRFSLFLVGAFAAAALFLAAAGLYAVLSYGVQQRTREIGVRLALGATQRQIFGLVFREGALLLGGGIASGLAIGLMLARLVANQMYEVSERDPFSFVVVSALLAGISLFACWIAARRALRVDPVVALRCD